MGQFDEIRAWAGDVMTGQKVRLRGVRPDDLTSLVAWWNDPSVQVFQQERIVAQPDATVRAMFESWSANDGPGAVGYAVQRLDGGLVGHLAIWGIAPPALVGTVAIVIGPEHQNAGLGRDALQVAIRLAFDELAARKLELQVWSFNDRAVALYESLGFVREGRRREVVHHRGRYHDQILMGLLATERR